MVECYSAGPTRGATSATACTPRGVRTANYLVARTHRSLRKHVDGVRRDMRLDADLLQQPETEGRVLLSHHVLNLIDQVRRPVVADNFLPCEERS